MAGGGLAAGATPATPLQATLGPPPRAGPVGPTASGKAYGRLGLWQGLRSPPLAPRPHGERSSWRRERVRGGARKKVPQRRRRRRLVGSSLPSLLGPSRPLPGPLRFITRPGEGGEILKHFPPDEQRALRAPRPGGPRRPGRAWRGLASLWPSGSSGPAAEPGASNRKSKGPRFTFFFI